MLVKCHGMSAILGFTRNLQSENMKKERERERERERKGEREREKERETEREERREKYGQIVSKRMRKKKDKGIMQTNMQADRDIAIQHT